MPFKIWVGSQPPKRDASPKTEKSRKPRTLRIFKHQEVSRGERKQGECQSFKCPQSELPARCCCRRILYEQPDFVNVKSNLETHCEARGFAVMFLPKFHCEINFLEQCWGHSKRTYRMNPPSTAEADLERNVMTALDGIGIDQMRR